METQHSPVLSGSLKSAGRNVSGTNSSVLDTNVLVIVRKTIELIELYLGLHDPPSLELFLSLFLHQPVTQELIQMRSGTMSLCLPHRKLLQILQHMGIYQPSLNADTHCQCLRELFLLRNLIRKKGAVNYTKLTKP